MTPVPHDLPLGLPAPVGVLTAVLVGFFLMHILFVTMMVGGTMMVLVAQVRGLKDKAWDHIAHDLAATITVNKSIAVVLGVGPLLAINTLYTVYFYTANALTGSFWILIVPLIAGAFLLTYAHKYLWSRLPVWLHLGLILVVMAIFAFVPLIFLVNVTLMLTPDRWGEVQGFWDAAMLPNVWTRYAHFMLSCPAMAGLMVVWLYRHKAQEDRAKVIRMGYHWLLGPTLAQFVVGPLALITLPPTPGSQGLAVAIFLGSILVAAFLCLVAWGELKRPDALIGQGFPLVAGAMVVILVLMGGARHLYREAALSDHRAAVAAKTEAFRAESEAARTNP